MTALAGQEHGLARPNWEYIRVDVLVTEHPKVMGLSDKAFRELIDLWCYCARQRSDGAVAAARWKRTPARVRRELIAAGLADPLLRDDPNHGVVMHDYIEHQRSRAEIDELAAKRADKARKAANTRWGNVKPPLCPWQCSEHAPSIGQAHAPRCLEVEVEAEADTCRWRGTGAASVSTLDK